MIVKLGFFLLVTVLSQDEPLEDVSNDLNGIIYQILDIEKNFTDSNQACVDFNFSGCDQVGSLAIIRDTETFNFTRDFVVGKGDNLNLTQDVYIGFQRLNGNSTDASNFNFIDGVTSSIGFGSSSGFLPWGINEPNVNNNNISTCAVIRGRDTNGLWFDRPCSDLNLALCQHNLTCSPTNSPSKSPTDFPSEFPTKLPTSSPTLSPTKPPTTFPTKQPSQNPTIIPTISPTKSPTKNVTNLGNFEVEEKKFKIIFLILFFIFFLLIFIFLFFLKKEYKKYKLLINRKRGAEERMKLFLGE